MAKKAKKIQELSVLMEGIVIDDFEKIDVSVLKEMVSETDEISDPRDSAYVKHKLSDIIMIVFFAILANADDWQEIEVFGKKKEKWLRRFLSLEHGVPTDDTYRIVMGKLDEKINQIYKTIIGFLIRKITEAVNLLTSPEEITKDSKIEKGLISIDGKVSKGSKREATVKEGSKALNTLSAYSSEWGMSIDQEFIDEKSNEIPAMPILIGRLNIRGSILTWDALNTQKDTVKAVIEGKGDYVGALKGNHGNLYNDVVDYFNNETLDEMKNSAKVLVVEEEKTYTKTVEKEHSAVITREYYLEPKIDWLYEREQWAGLKAIGVEVKKIEKNTENAQPIYERRYFISSLTDTADFARAVRGHWGIENGLHWHLDYTLKDDKNTTTSNNGAKGLQLLKKAALALLKIAQVIYPPRTSLKRIRYRLSLDYEREIERIFSALSVDSIREVFAK